MARPSRPDATPLARARRAGVLPAFYCASVTRCYPGRPPPGGATGTPSLREQELCEFWRDRELDLLRPQLIVPVGGLALRRLLGRTDLTACIGERFDRDGVAVVPLPHPSGASSWPNVPANRARLTRALALVHDELGRVRRGTAGADDGRDTLA